MAIKLIKRIFSYILVLFGLSVLIFVIVRVMPGDTARMALGARAPESAVAALSQEMRLDPVSYTHLDVYKRQVYPYPLYAPIQIE